MNKGMTHSAITHHSWTLHIFLEGIEVSSDNQETRVKQNTGMPANPIEIASSSDDEDEGYDIHSADRKPDMVTTIVYLETGVLDVVLGRTSTHVQREFFETVVAKKVAIRHNIRGYTICMREMLLKYRHMREALFPLFFSVLLGDVPSGDIIWGNLLSSSANYQLVSFKSLIKYFSM